MRVKSDIDGLSSPASGIPFKEPKLLDPHSTSSLDQPASRHVLSIWGIRDRSGVPKPAIVIKQTWKVDFWV